MVRDLVYVKFCKARCPSSIINADDLNLGGRAPDIKAADVHTVSANRPETSCVMFRKLHFIIKSEDMDDIKTK